MKRTPLKRTGFKKKIKLANKPLFAKQKALKNTAAWRWFSFFVRLKGCQDGGFDKCFTCGNMKNFKDMNAGHYIHKIASTMFDEDNVRKQCIHCNKWLSGNLGQYNTRLVKQLGQQRVDLLKFKSKQTKKYTKEELKTISKFYREKVKKLVITLGVEI